jgi:hypothetical protein
MSGEPADILFGHSKIQFNGNCEMANRHRVHASIALVIRSLVMIKSLKTTAVVLLLVLAAPATSFARMAGEAGMGNVPISGISPGPANIGGMNNATVDPSGIANANKVAPIPPPPMSVPVVPQFK